MVRHVPVFCCEINSQVLRVVVALPVSMKNRYEVPPPEFMPLAIWIFVQVCPPSVLWTSSSCSCPHMIRCCGS